MHLTRSLLILMIALALFGCQNRGKTPAQLPTIAAREALETAVVQTENAPPPGFRDTVSFPSIDDNIVVLPSWTMDMTIAFTGQFAGTGREVSGSSTVQITYRQVGQRRRVVVQREGELLGVAEGETQVIEGVRIASNVFRVQDNVCGGSVREGEPILADLRAGDLIGGVEGATPASGQERVNGADVWRYAFTGNDIVMPPVMKSGTVSGMNGELWVAPEHNAVIRYYVNMNIENALIFNSEVPVSGQLIVRYDLAEIGVDPNITRPFGC